MNQPNDNREKLIGRAEEDTKLLFDFSEALKRMKQGKKVKRANKYVAYGITNYEKPIKISFLVLYAVDSFAISSLDADDILATDWEEVEE